VTGTEIGDLGEWHATAGVQNIPGPVDDSARSTGSSTRTALAALGPQPDR
jgi:hypothetical protein